MSQDTDGNPLGSRWKCFLLQGFPQCQSGEVRDIESIFPSLRPNPSSCLQCQAAGLWIVSESDHAIHLSECRSG